MDKFESYNLHDGHLVRYFWKDDSLPRLLNRVRKWAKTGVEVHNVDLNSRFDEEESAIVWDATVIYGVVEAQ